MHHSEDMTTNTIKASRVKLAGRRAIEAAEQGAPLYVRSFSGIVPADPGTVERARRMDPHALWIYVTIR